MGKNTGFMEYERTDMETEKVSSRCSHYREFHTLLPKALRQQQGARCMDCGVPFCQSGVMINGMVSGCPLHNLIPEWNDFIYRDQMELAYQRLQKTNNFPEFTGRVCPAPCEKACVCALHQEAITIKDNEYDIIEQAFSKRYVKPMAPAIHSGKKVAVIGSGPSGLAVADELNKRGHEVTIYEQADKAGGLLMYGIPSMKLEKHIIERRVSIMQQAGIRFQLNTAIRDRHAVERLLQEYDAIALACGSRIARDISAEGRHAKGIHFALDYLSQSTKAVMSHATPTIDAKDQHVVIIGGGDTGNDCCATALRQKAKSVTQLEMMPEPPTKRPIGNAWPQWPKTLKTDYGQQECKEIYGKDPRLFGTTVKAFLYDQHDHLHALRLVKLDWRYDEKTKRLISHEVKDSEFHMHADLALIAAGFTGCETDLTQALEVATENGKVVTNHYQTIQPNIFALGDMRRGQSLVVWAIKEGRDCAIAIDEYLSKS